ncbi:monooxygenase 3-like isoform X2 [Punica granatum]|uniref:Monooxygenase 3-like isoform X2 n=1 Tax=Punica granatum TaxID=22663 RepID=A0A6P8CJN6_PUNGR|nr:monooxygenase 3-like isoform X2 [Punica granatum]
MAEDREQVDHREWLKTISAMSGLQTTQRQFSFKGRPQEEFEMRCVQRKNLLVALERELPKGTIRFSSKVVSVEESGQLKLIHLADGSVLKAKVLIGCDGVNSAVAKWLGLKSPAFSGRAAIRGFVNYNRAHGLEPMFTQCFGKGVRFGMVPYDDTSAYWFFTWSPSPQEKDIAEDPMKMKQFLLSKLGNVPDQVREVYERTELENMIMSPLRYRHPWELALGNISKGNVCVAGDAFHPMTPDLAQGGCSALEDGVILARCLGQALKNNDNGKLSMEQERKRIETGLKNYDRERRWRGVKLISAAFMVGYIQQGNGKVLTFLRDRVLAAFLAERLVDFASFDCGKL